MNTDPPEAAVRSEHCAAVAADRAKEAGYAGYDRDVQDRVWAQTYNTCRDNEKKQAR